MTGEALATEAQAMPAAPDAPITTATTAVRAAWAIRVENVVFTAGCPFLDAGDGLSKKGRTRPFTDPQ
jgi:hypothetical protein